jgi:hypothetical protein
MAEACVYKREIACISATATSATLGPDAKLMWTCARTTHAPMDNAHKVRIAPIFIG